MRTTRKSRRQAKRLFALCLAKGVLDEDLARRVVSRVVRSGRRDRLPVLSHFHKLVALEIARRTANVESAIPLPPDLRAFVQAGLERIHGNALKITFAEQPALIGGLRIRVGSYVYDGSVRGGFLAIQSRFGNSDGVRPVS